nr:transcriptional regulator [Halococcus sediminicola]
MADEWDVISFVIRSRYRVKTLDRLSDDPAIPSRIASDQGVLITHISRALDQLSDRELVELLVSDDRRKGRLYGLTEHGETIWGRMNELDLN